MSDITGFLKIMDELIELLELKSNQTAPYFKKIRDKLMSIQDSSELKQVLSEMAKVGTIAQYGDLSPKQDQVLTKLLQEADRLSRT
jgi:molybdate-binding protein